MTAIGMVLYWIVGACVAIAVVAMTGRMRWWGRSAVVLATCAWVAVVGCEALVISPRDEHAAKPRRVDTPFGLSRSEEPAFIIQGPLLPWYVSAGRFSIQFGKDLCAPGCGPIALASIMNVNRHPTWVSQRDVDAKVEVGGVKRILSTSMGGYPYEWGTGARDERVGKLVRDIGYLAGTTWDPEGSGTSIDGLSAALSAMDYHWRSSHRWRGIIGSLRRGRPVVLSANVPEGHYVVADGVGVDADGHDLVHVWTGLPQPPSGWYRRESVHPDVTVDEAIIDIVPNPPVTMPVLVREPAFITMPVLQ